MKYQKFSVKVTVAGKTEAAETRVNRVAYNFDRLRPRARSG